MTKELGYTTAFFIKFPPGKAIMIRATHLSIFFW